ncbi:hypothetical protein PG999_004430 [Apiospora kogelbergensis]|uniref:J domain-containing protein n=1 Tax=Apiospora kogelbergensis TaxID=1337665 RepID=A0AAW0QZ83_9PEZI
MPAGKNNEKPLQPPHLADPKAKITKSSANPKGKAAKKVQAKALQAVSSTEKKPEDGMEGKLDDCMDIDSDGDDGNEDAKQGNPVLARIQQEFDSENSNYYTLFDLAPPKGSEEPLDTDSLSHVQKRGVEYLAAVNGSDVQNKEEWVRFIKAATATLSQPDAKRIYDEERVRQNAAEMGGQKNSKSGLFMPSNQQTGLLELYNGITTDLEAYLDKADDPNKTPEELANENCEPLDRFNDKLVTDYGEEYGREHALPYSYLKIKYREVSRLEKKIDTAIGNDKEALSRELQTLHATIQKYLITRNLPGDWASLLHTPPPPANFDTSIDSKWDHCYSKYPRSKNGDRIFIAWKGKSKAVSDKTDKIFLMTPQGLLCEDIGAPYSEEHNFMTEHPEYEYLKSVHHYEKADISGIQDAWSQGGRSKKAYPTIYCLLQFKGTNVFRVASRSTAMRYQKGFGDSAIAICEGKGIIFEKPHKETGTSKKTHGKKKVGTKRVWTDEDRTRLREQLESSEVSRLRRQVEQLAEQLNRVLALKAPVMAQ